MKNLIVHLSFAGNCEEAMNFYKSCFGGEILSKQTYGEMPMPELPVPDEHKSKILHIDYKFNDIIIMGADGFDKTTPTIGNNIALTLSFDDVKEQETVFNKLMQGGTVTMPLQDMFWNAKFGMVLDKFGINWMLNCDKPKAAN